MMKIVISVGVGIALGVYFVFGLYILPEHYLTRPLPESQAVMSVQVSDSQISIGDSFEVQMTAENHGEIADILVLSIAFPTLEIIDDRIKIVSYDFTQSPINIEMGDEIGAEYLASQKTVLSQYPSIEAYSRPALTGIPYHMTLSITPKQVGDFVFYTKSVTLPHLNPLSHFPHEGEIDHSGEYVEVYSVRVNP